MKFPVINLEQTKEENSSDDARNESSSRAYEAFVSGLHQPDDLSVDNGADNAAGSDSDSGKKKAIDENDGLMEVYDETEIKKNKVTESEEENGTESEKENADDAAGSDSGKKRAIDENDGVMEANNETESKTMKETESEGENETESGKENETESEKENETGTGSENKHEYDYEDGKPSLSSSVDKADSSDAEMKVTRTTTTWKENGLNDTEHVDGPQPGSDGDDLSSMKVGLSATGVDLYQPRDISFGNDTLDKGEVEQVADDSQLQEVSKSIIS